MNPTVEPVSATELIPWRQRYRQEMNCQIVHDSLHEREGWTRPYMLHLGDATAGYGSVLVGGPWLGTRTLFEFYVVPERRSRVFDLFDALLAASEATHIHAQTNDTLLTVMLHTWVADVKSEKIVFHDKLTTALPPAGAVLRRAVVDDGVKWLLEVNGTTAATGRILFHYNRPYGDIYMEVAEPLRRRGLGSYLVQELKRACYESGSVPCARCDTTNVASRKALQKAGFVPCAHILSGPVVRRR
ncbi:MAG: GNAT family N-acetyltransferase [Gemmatimonadota bacterium]|nr:GNAT family N-acetyltransferase [Gemmatimonadota bacterium]